MTTANTFTRWMDCEIVVPAPPPAPVRKWYHGILVPWMSENQPEECIPCGRAKIFEWLGMNWIGYPKPLRFPRWRRRVPNIEKFALAWKTLNGHMFIYKYAGCGCIERLKKLYPNFIQHYLFLGGGPQKP
jgi:hypothetical protein